MRCKQDTDQYPKSGLVRISETYCTVDVRNSNIRFGKLNKIQFGFQLFGFQTFVCLIIRLYYKCPKSERSVGQVVQPNVRLKSELFRNGTTLESAEIRTFAFQTVFVIIISFFYSFFFIYYFCICVLFKSMYILKKNF